jgi:hypothetical protein
LVLGEILPHSTICSASIPAAEIGDHNIGFFLYNQRGRLRRRIHAHDGALQLIPCDGSGEQIRRRALSS